MEYRGKCPVLRVLCLVLSLAEVFSLSAPDGSEATDSCKEQLIQPSSGYKPEALAGVLYPSTSKVPANVELAPVGVKWVQSTGKITQAQCGNSLPREAVLDAPDVEIAAFFTGHNGTELRGYDADEYYTYVMADPDAPTPKDPTSQSYLHYLVSNVRPDEEPLELLPYQAPTPPPGSAAHRYLLCVYSQYGEELGLKYWDMAVPAVTSKDRANFDFAKLNGFHHIKLAGCNFFRVEQKARKTSDLMSRLQPKMK